jgi:hypothetical protein
MVNGCREHGKHAANRPRARLRESKADRVRAPAAPTAEPKEPPMTFTSPNSADRPAARPSKAELFGTVLMLGIAAVVIGTGVILSFAAVALGGTALELP